MPETTLKKQGCENCGVEVRENTQFCHNCGKSVLEKGQDAMHVTADSNGAIPNETSGEARSALDDLADKLNTDRSAEDPLAQAAAQRKKARTRPRKKSTVVWEAAEAGTDRVFVLTTLLIVTITDIKM